MITEVEALVETHAEQDGNIKLQEAQAGQEAQAATDAAAAERAEQAARYAAGLADVDLSAIDNDLPKYLRADEWDWIEESHRMYRRFGLEPGPVLRARPPHDPRG